MHWLNKLCRKIPPSTQSSLFVSLYILSTLYLGSRVITAIAGLHATSTRENRERTATVST